MGSARLFLHSYSELEGNNTVLNIPKILQHLFISKNNNTGPFIMFSVITNIYNKKTKGPTLMELFTATEKLKHLFFFLYLEMFYVVHHGCTTSNIEPVQRHLQRLMGDHLISACTDTQFQ